MKALEVRTKELAQAVEALEEVVFWAETVLQGLPPGEWDGDAMRLGDALDAADKALKELKGV